jgi:hypothetical protein
MKAIGSISVDIKIGGALVAALAVLVGVSMMKQKQSSPTIQSAKTVSAKQGQPSLTVPKIKPKPIKTKPKPVKAPPTAEKLIESVAFYDHSDHAKALMNKCIRRKVAVRADDIITSCTKVASDWDESAYKAREAAKQVKSASPAEPEIESAIAPGRYPVCIEKIEYMVIATYLLSGANDQATEILTQDYLNGDCAPLQAGETVIILERDTNEKAMRVATESGASGWTLDWTGRQ